MHQRQPKKPETFVIDDIHTFLVNDLTGRRTIIGLGLPPRQPSADHPLATASGSIAFGLEGEAGLWLRLLQPTDVLRDLRVPSDDDVLADVTDTAMGRRLVSCLMCDAAGIPQGSKAIARFLHRHWTTDLADRFGPVPNPRTVRLWRATRGRMERRRSIEMVSCRGRSYRKAHFPPDVKSALERVVQAAIDRGTSAAEAHEVLRSEMQEGDRPIVARHRAPSLSTVIRRMRVARIHGTRTPDGAHGTACGDAARSDAGGSSNTDDR